MLCRAGRIVLIKASFADIDANLIALSAFTANRLPILSLGDGGREKQPRWSIQMWGENVRRLWVLCPLHTARREHRTAFGEAACCIAGVQCPFTLHCPSKGKQGWQCMWPWDFCYCLAQLCQSKLKSACTVCYKPSFSPHFAFTSDWLCSL